MQVIFEHSIQTGKLPLEWCRAQVTPVFKKGDKSSAANYRPISLTCILCKVLEHIMASHLVKHLDKHDLLYDLQHGFREKRSCETQLTMLFEDLAKNTSAGKQTDLILLDFSKAFDKVNHSKLLWKLHQYGIRGNALSWIRAFLGDRSQTVVLEGEESGSVPVTSGVFADDTAVYLTVGGSDDGTVLQNYLDRLSMLESQWDMEFNPSKCQVVRVTTARKAINTVYRLHGQVLDVVSSAKYLGVDISGGLSWNSNIDRITGNANRTLGYIKRNIKTKNSWREKQPIIRLSALSWSMLPPFGTPTQRKKHTSLKKSKEGLHAGPLVTTITGQV